MQTQEDQLELLNGFLKYKEKREKLIPEVAAASEALIDAVFKDGALSQKDKRLIAMAVALTAKCTPCLIGQTKRAANLGATKEEILEAASVVLSVQGTGGFGEIWRIIKILEELGMA